MSEPETIRKEDTDKPMKIKVYNNGSFSIDDKETTIKDLTSTLLEKIVSLSLEEKVTFQIEGDTPISNFFSTLSKGTQEGSELKELYKKTVNNSDDSGSEKSGHNSSASES